MKNIKIIFLFVLVLLVPAFNIRAEEVSPVEEVEEIQDVLISENIFVRAGEQVLFQGVVEIQQDGNIEILDNTGAAHSVPSLSVLGALYAADQVSEDFSISNIEYYASFDALYLKCITPKNGESFCDNWQYVVNNAVPSTGMDKTMLSADQNIGIYFGSNHRLILEKNSITTKDSLSVQAQKYNYLDNSWGGLSDVSIGFTTPNEADPYNPIVAISKKTDLEGFATFDAIDEGTYQVGIAEDFYFPSYELIVAKAEEIVSSGGGGGAIIHNKIDVNKAVSFLLSKQKPDGSFGPDLYTDWSAVGLAKVLNVDLSSLKRYLTENILPDGLSLTDYERRAFALSALDISPASGTKRNYIKDILEGFDGKQFGDENLYNDDIFAVFVLLHSGYTKEDLEIKKPIEFIISKQNTDGSWDGVDITSAAIQLLVLVKDLPDVVSSLEKARLFILSKQEENGGFGSSFSTSWAMGAIKSLGENSDDLQKNNKNANDFLYSLQNPDGGLESSETNEIIRIWATSYAIPSVLGLDWHSILNTFEKEPEQRLDSSDPNSDLNDNKQGRVLGAEKFVFTLFLKLDSHKRVPSKMNEIRELQRLLNKHNYGPLEVDGKFGSLTENAVLEFQKNNNLIQDGIVGVLTRAELNKIN